MKTTLNVTNILFFLVKESPLAGAITGQIRKQQRPANSQKEDIVITCLPIDNEQLQECVANINIYVPCFTVKENNVQTDAPDFARLETLTGIAANYFKGIRKTQDYQVEWEQMSGAIKDPESNSWFVNIRLKFRAYNIA